MPELKPEMTAAALRLHPLRFEPSFQYRLWGGHALGEWMGKPLPGDDPIGEAWLLSDRPDQASRVAEGPLKGRTLTELMDQAGDQILGRMAGRFDRFPLLLKFLDVQQMLSVQVHPSDDDVELIPPGDTGKTEAWVVLDAKPAARIYAGLKPGATAEDLRNLSTETVDDRLASFRPEAGQGVLIEAGTVHTLGDGLLVFEVQENSDTTFRLYDWGHVDAKTGKPRPLQVDQALACVDFHRGPVKPVAPRIETTAPVRREALFDNAHFRLDRVHGAQPLQVGAAGEPRVLVCVEGAGRIDGEHGLTMSRGDVVLLPASVGQRAFHPDTPVTLLEIAIPDRP